MATSIFTAGAVGDNVLAWAETAALIESLQITSPATPEVISTVLDAFLQERGSFDFGRGFDMKSTITEIISGFFLAIATELPENTQHPTRELVALVLFFFNSMFPPIKLVNEFSAKFSNRAKISLDNEVVNKSTFNDLSILFYVKAEDVSKDAKALRHLHVSWKRQRAFASRHNLSSMTQNPEMVLECVVGELLTADLKHAWANCGEFTRVDKSDYEALGVSSIVVSQFYNGKAKFALLREDLNRLCSENFDHFFENIIKPSMEAIGAENRDQKYWNSWDSTTTSQKFAVNVLHGLEDVVSREQCMELWKRKRTAIWEELSNNFTEQLRRHANSMVVADSHGKGMLFFMLMGTPGRFRGINTHKFKLLCRAFTDKIPEIRMMKDEIDSNIAILGLETDLNGRPLETAAKPENLTEGMEHIRGFYERLVKGELKSTDLTSFSEPYYLNLDFARAAFDRRLSTPSDGQLAADGSKHAASEGSSAAISRSTALPLPSSVQTDPLSNSRKRPHSHIGEPGESTDGNSSSKSAKIVLD